jgi:predicted dehydrogenase
MPYQLNRRQFLQTSTLAGAGVLLAGKGALARVSPNEKLNIAVIGVRGRGADNVAGVRNENIVAVCDVDENNLAAAAKEFPSAKTYADYRKMLERKDIDAVVVSTPDHTHAVATMAALNSGRHVYCEKPLTHSVWETRQVIEAARKHKRITQLGTQIHATDNYRRVVELVRSGVIGPVREVHVWVGRVWAGKGRPTETPPVPATLSWDLWLGPAPERPYHPAYVPFNWRGWWDFGGGTLADMACHHVDLPKWALKLGPPLTVEAEGPEVNPETTPAWLIVRYAFPELDGRPAVNLTWYNGDRRPPHFKEGGLPEWGDGTLFVGEKGMILADYGRHVLLPEKDFQGIQPPTAYIPNSIGHHEEWIQACKNGGTTTCNFDYGGELTETVLLGNVSYRTGRKLEWDPKSLKAKNCPEADAFIHPAYRKGWRL